LTYSTKLYLKKKYLRQFISADEGNEVFDESPQSSSPSHFHDLEIHLPFEHLKSTDEQLFFSVARCLTKTNTFNNYNNH